MVRSFDFPEGATPIADCSDLIPNWVHHLEDLNRVEAENIVQAQRKYLTKKVSDPKLWFNVRELRSIHEAMFGNVWKWAGNYRKSITSIGIRPALIPSRLAEFCNEVISWSSDSDFNYIERAARIHHQLVFIHPFENGNGRFSRFISDRYLLATKCSHPIWPSGLNHESQSRKEYIVTLKCADIGDYRPLVNYMKQLGAGE